MKSFKMLVNPQPAASTVSPPSSISLPNATSPPVPVMEKQKTPPPFSMASAMVRNDYYSKSYPKSLHSTTLHEKRLFESVFGPRFLQAPENLTKLASFPGYFQFVGPGVGNFALITIVWAWSCRCIILLWARVAARCECLSS
jgi:hypothetical protein